MSEMYQFTFKLTPIRTRGTRVLCPMVHQTITPGSGPLCRYRMQAGDLRSPRIIQTCTRPSEYCTQNRDLSEKTTLGYSCIQLCRSESKNCKSHHFSLCCNVRRNWRNGCRTDMPRCCKHWHTVWSETKCDVNMFNSWLMVRDVIIWFSSADLTLCLSWSIVKGVYWDPAYRSVCPSSTH